LFQKGITFLYCQYQSLLLTFCTHVVLKVYDIGLMLWCNDVPWTLFILWSRDYVYNVLEVGCVHLEVKNQGVKGSTLFSPIKLGRVTRINFVLQTQMNRYFLSLLVFLPKDIDIVSLWIVAYIVFTPDNGQCQWNILTSWFCTHI
jgi:hypothetical protein